MESDKYMECDMCGGWKKASCPRCSGSGHGDVCTYCQNQWPAKMACSECKGEGYSKCPLCGGEGKVTCPKCEGRGIILRPEFR
jgi:hypothetical protein